MRVEPLELEIGLGLMDLADTARGGDLLDRVRALRRKVAMELGIVIPRCGPATTSICPRRSTPSASHGVEVARGEAPGGSGAGAGGAAPGRAGHAHPRPGVRARRLLGAGRVRPPGGAGRGHGRRPRSVVTAHMAEVVRGNAGRLLSRQDVKMLVDAVRATDPVVADEFGAAGLSLAEVQRVLQGLLEEVVPIRDLVRILEVLSERARVTKDPEVLTEAVRVALGPSISAGHATEGKLPVLTLDPLLEHALLESLRPGEAGSFLALDAEVAERLLAEVSAAATSAEQQGRQPVLVCAAPIRPALRRLVRNVNPGLAVLSYLEIGPAARAREHGSGEPCPCNGVRERTWSRSWKRSATGSVTRSPSWRPTGCGRAASAGSSPRSASRSWSIVDAGRDAGAPAGSVTGSPPSSASRPPRLLRAPARPGRRMHSDRDRAASVRTGAAGLDTEGPEFAAVLNSITRHPGRPGAPSRLGPSALPPESFRAVATVPSGGAPARRRPGASTPGPWPGSACPRTSAGRLAHPALRLGGDPAGLAPRALSRLCPFPRAGPQARGRSSSWPAAWRRRPRPRPSDRRRARSSTPTPC